MRYLKLSQLKLLRLLQHSKYMNCSFVGFSHFPDLLFLFSFQFLIYSLKISYIVCILIIPTHNSQLPLYLHHISLSTSCLPLFCLPSAGMKAVHFHHRPPVLAPGNPFEPSQHQLLLCDSQVACFSKSISHLRFHLSGFLWLLVSNRAQPLPLALLPCPHLCLTKANSSASQGLLSSLLSFWWY